MLDSALRDIRFDLTGDGLVDYADGNAFIDEVGILAGDTDLDGEVAFSDFLKLAQKFGQDGQWADGDADWSGSVGFSDFLALSQNFGSRSKGPLPVPTTAPVPEPNSRLLLLIGFVCFAQLLRRRS